MIILIDANIIVTFLTRRDDPFLQETDKLFQLCAEGKIFGYVALQTLPIVWYVLRKLPHQARRNKMKSICHLLKLAVTDMESIQQALANNSFTDFEDNLQDCCAQQVNAEYIVTANVRDYDAHSVVKSITPSELLDILNYSYTDSQWEIHEQHVEYNSNSCTIPFPPHLHILISSPAA